MTTETLLNVDDVRRWLRTNERSVAWLARHAGVNASHLGRIIHGDRPLMDETQKRVTDTIRYWNSPPD